MRQGNLDKSQRLTLVTILMLSFFSSFGNPIIIPLFPSIRAYFGISPVETTLLISMYALPGIVVIPILGFLQDRLGRKPILLISLLISIAGCIGIGLCTSFAAMLGWRMVLGLSVTPLEAMCNTLISDHFSQEERLKYIGHSTSALFAGVAAVPLVSTALLLSFGWRAALMSPAAMAVPLVFLCLRMPMRYTASEFALPSYLANLRVILLSPKMISLFSIRILSALVMFGTMHSYMPFLITEKLGGSDSMPGMVMALFSIFLALGSMLLGMTTRRAGAVRMGVYAGALIVCGMIGFVFVSSLFFIFIPLALFGFGAGTMQALNNAQVAQCVRANAKGTVMSVYATAFRSAQALSPVLCSFLYVKGGFTMLYGVAALVSAGVTVLCYHAFRMPCDIGD